MNRSILLGAAGLVVLVGCGKGEGPQNAAVSADSATPTKTPPRPSTTVAAGGNAPRPPAAPKADPCRPFYDEGSRLFGEKKLDEAAASFAKGYEQCGPGYGFLQAQGFVRAEQGKIEEAGNLYLKEISEPRPKPEAFGNLERIRDKLSAATKARIVAMGGQASSPVHVIGVRGEYTWARAFTCMGAKSLLEQRQEMAKGARGEMLDKLSFKCPDGTAHTVFFDYGSDPDEEAYKREREAIEKEKKGAP